MSQLPSSLPEGHEDHPGVVSRNARVGVVLFLIYFGLYGGFLLLNVFAPRVMSDSTLPLGEEHTLYLGGANLAIAGGIGLILAAVLLSLIYMRMTKTSLPATTT